MALIFNACELNKIIKPLIMKQNVLLASLFALSLTLTSCDAIAGIFKAGMWVGVIIVVGIIALVLWLIGKAKN